ncbi:MAG: hypothetical protein KKH88_04640 [Nanoarchaeota archaeon]|nr:hypothetical protein [Nanoarchaeota archaeon]
MKHERTAVVIGLMALLFFSSWLMGSGITGLYQLDWEQSYCSTNADCYIGEVCCPFYNNNGGVCDTEDKCSAVYRLTMEMGGQTSINEETQTISHLEQPRSVAINVAYIFIGIVLIILTILGFSHIHPEKRKKAIKKKTLKKKSNKKK